MCAYKFQDTKTGFPCNTWRVQRGQAQHQTNTKTWTNALDRQALKLPWLHALDDEVKEAEGKIDAAAVGTTTAATTAAKMNQPLHLSSKLRRFTGMSNLKRTALNVIANQLTEADIGRCYACNVFCFWTGRGAGEEKSRAWPAMAVSDLARTLRSWAI